ncbi:MAG TPA: penicillin acylase family protein [Magnetospirillaceae bacterium]|jgi:penicillin amidase
MRFVFRIIVVLIVIILVALGAGYFWLTTSLPTVAGNIRLQGLTSEVVIARDNLGVPRIVAQNANDAYFALGFAHAQDRLWQMELQRRVGAGRMSELVGADALPLDKFMRTLGLYHLAEQSVDTLPPDIKKAFEAYAAGVNAYINNRQGALPPEFVLLRSTPEPWKVADSLVWGRLMGLQLSGNWRDELLRGRVAAKVPPDQVNDLWPAYPANQPITLAANDAGNDTVRHAAAAVPSATAALTKDTLALFEKMVAAIPAEGRPRLASNEWVLSGSRTATGKPLLANDPHLALDVPVLWYLASIVAPDLEVTGVTAPGVPAVVLGHNKRIAWGFTTTSSDTMDLFIEKTDGDGYVTPDGTKPFVTRDEVIKVRGAAPVTIKVRSTRHGPVVTDILGDDAGGQVLALSANFLEPGDINGAAIMNVNRAQNWDQFLGALKDFVAPEQNASYADVDGHIGLIAPAKVPIRKAGDGTVPRPGWTGEFDWTGWIPFEELPRVFDPPSGVIVNANNRLVPDSYPHLLTVSWPEGYRAQRIVDLLGNRTGLTPHDMSTIQMDEMDLAAAQLNPLLMKTPPVGPQETAAHQLLQNWNGEADQHGPEALIFNSWIEHLQRDLLKPWLGDIGKSFDEPRPQFLAAVLTGRTVWCAPPGSVPPANCDAVVAQSLGETVADLAASYGPNMADWHWGTAHRATLDALLFGRIPVLDKLTRLDAPKGGDDFTVQRGAYQSVNMVLFPNHHGAGFRGIYDLSDLNSSRFVITTGQSGNPLSDHWGDMFERWLAGASIMLDPGRARPDVLTLAPAQ